MVNSENLKIGILGSGWLGSAIGKELSTRGYSVWGTTTRGSRLGELRDEGITPVLLKLGNRGENENPVLPEADFILLFMSPQVIWNERHTLSRMVRSCGAKSMLLASSTSVYPDSNGRVKEEDAEYIQSAHSGIVMLSLEDHFRNLTDIQTVVFRFGGLYGPGRDPGRFLSGRAILDGGDAPVNLVHQEDCIRAVLTVLNATQQTGTYNICADEHPSRSEFYTYAAEKLGVEPPRFSGKKMDFKIVDNSLFKRTFDFEYVHPVMD